MECETERRRQTKRRPPVLRMSKVGVCIMKTLKIVYVIRLSLQLSQFDSLPRKYHHSSGFYRRLHIVLTRERILFQTRVFVSLINNRYAPRGIKLITRLSGIPRNDYTFSGSLTSQVSFIVDLLLINCNCR